jgi:signal transduction histidine kinase
MSSIRKITILLIISISLILIFLGSSVYYYLSNYSYADFYKRLEARVSVAEKHYFETNQKNARILKSIREEHLELLSDEKEYVLYCPNTISIKQLADTHSIPVNFLKLVYTKQFANFQKGETFYHGKKRKTQKGFYFIIVSAKNYYNTHHLILLKKVLFAGGFISILIIIYFTYIFSKRLFEPIDKIITKVNSISTDNIHLRLDHNKNTVEIDRLTTTFNNLLNRIEIAFETNKNFISNASHEFGTPLTAIIGEADVALLKDRTPVEYKEALQKILKHSERLNKISQSLLFLAQIGYKENKLNYTILRTDELILQANEIMNQLVPKNNIKIDFELLPENPKKLKIFGNKELLLLAITNILTNACKYSSNKPVVVSLASTNNEILMIFKDQGIGIPESELAFIYDPFFRASNTAAYDGYGIGLPLTQNIIKIHKGELLISSVQHKGVTVQVKIPIALLQKS